MTPLSYILTIDDLIYGSRLAMRRQLAKNWWKFLIFIIAISAAIPLLMILWEGWNTEIWFEGFYTFLAIYLPLGIIFWLAVYYLLVARRARKQFAQMPMLSREQKLHWENGKLYFESANGSAHFEMGELHRCCGDERMLLLYPAGHLFYMLPRRIFESGAQFDELINCLKQNGAKWL